MRNNSVQKERVMQTLACCKSAQKSRGMDRLFRTVGYYCFMLQYSTECKRVREESVQIKVASRKLVHIHTYTYRMRFSGFSG